MEPIVSGEVLREDGRVENLTFLIQREKEDGWEVCGTPAGEPGSLLTKFDLYRGWENRLDDIEGSWYAFFYAVPKPEYMDEIIRLYREWNRPIR